MKKILSVAFIFVFISAFFPACDKNAGKEYPLTVNSTPVDGEIFRYFLDKVWDSEISRDGRITAATHMCIRYVAVNSTFAACGLSLSAAERAHNAEQADALWRLFGAHYASIGVSKQTFLKILTSESFIEKLRSFFYGAGGKYEISESALKNCLNENYAAFFYIRTPLKYFDSAGNEAELSASETESLKELYVNSSALITPAMGTQLAFAKIADKYPLTEESADIKIITASDSEYSSAFFEAVKKMRGGTAAVTQYGDCIYLIYSIDVLSDDAIFDACRENCLKLLSEAPLQNEINKMCGNYKSKRDMPLVNKYYRQIGSMLK